MLCTNQNREREYLCFQVGGKNIHAFFWERKKKPSTYSLQLSEPLLSNRCCLATGVCHMHYIPWNVALEAPHFIKGDKIGGMLNYAVISFPSSFMAGICIPSPYIVRPPFVCHISTDTFHQEFTVLVNCMPPCQLM